MEGTKDYIMTLEQLLSVTQFGTEITLIIDQKKREFLYDLSINSNAAFLNYLNYTVICVSVNNNRLIIEIR